MKKLLVLALVVLFCTAGVADARVRNIRPHAVTRVDAVLDFTDNGSFASVREGSTPGITVRPAPGYGYAVSLPMQSAHNITVTGAAVRKYDAGVLYITPDFQPWDTPPYSVSISIR